MGPVDTNNPTTQLVNFNGKLPPQVIANVKEEHPKSFGKFVIPYQQYWNESNSFDKTNESKQTFFLPNFPSLINQNLNNSYATPHNWSAQFQATQHDNISNTKNQSWEGVNNHHSSVPSSPDHSNNSSSSSSSSSSSNVNTPSHSQLNSSNNNYHPNQITPIQTSHFSTPNSSPILSPNSYIQASYALQSNNEDYDRELKRKTPLKSIPQSSITATTATAGTPTTPNGATAFDFNQLTVAAYLHQQQELINKKQKSSNNIETSSSSLPSTPHSSSDHHHHLERSTSLSSFNFTPRGESVPSSSSTPTTPSFHSSSSIRSISPEMSSFISGHHNNHHHHQPTYNNSHHHHHHPHHFSAPSSPNHHPISLPLLLTASASLPVTPTMGSTPSFDHAALAFSNAASLNSSGSNHGHHHHHHHHHHLSSSANNLSLASSTPSMPVCSCLASKHVKPSLSPSDAKALNLSNQTPATLECEEFNVPLECFEEWMETEGKISGVTYIKSGGKVIGAHADRKTLNLKAEYEKPRNGVRKTKRELLWTQKYVCSRAGLPKKKQDEESPNTNTTKDNNAGVSPSSNRKKSVSKKCGCQSRIVISVYADDKSLAVVRKIADHSAHMTQQQIDDLKHNYQRHFCLVHSNAAMTQQPQHHTQQQQQHHQLQSSNYPHSDDASLLLATSSIASQQQSSNFVQPTFDSQNNTSSQTTQHLNTSFTLPSPQIKKDQSDLFSAYQQYNNHSQSRFNTLVANLN